MNGFVKRFYSNDVDAGVYIGITPRTSTTGTPTCLGTVSVTLQRHMEMLIIKQDTLLVADLSQLTRPRRASTL